MDNFGIRKLMSWSKLKDGELAVMDNNGTWKSYTQHPLFKMLKSMNQHQELQEHLKNLIKDIFMFHALIVMKVKS